MRDLRIDEAAWSAANAARRAEWRTVIDDLLEDGDFASRSQGRYVLVTVATDDVHFEFLDDDGFVVETISLPVPLLRPRIDEYLAVIRRLDEGAGHRESSWIESVDMAKKVIHDGAARALIAAAPSFAADHDTGRLLFSLVVSLLVDTTKLAHAHGHRRA